MMRSAFFKNERRGALVPGLKLVSGPASMIAIAPHIRQLTSAGGFDVDIGVDPEESEGFRDMRGSHRLITGFHHDGFGQHEHQELVLDEENRRCGSVFRHCFNPWASVKTTTKAA